MNLLSPAYFADRECAARAYIHMIIMYAKDDDIHMTWSEALIQAIATTPKFRRDWINPN